jgi:hypothetical protein
VAFRLFPRSRREKAPIQATIELSRFATGSRRYEARPVRLAVRGKEVLFDPQDFVAYGWTPRAARKRCLEKVVAYLRVKAKIPEE